MKYVDLPQDLSREVYDKCSEEFVELSKQNSDIISVYLCGSVLNPGISDLDFVICLKDKLKSEIKIDSQIKGNLRLLIGNGSILKFNESNFSNTNIIDDFNSVYLAGKKFKFKEFNDNFFELCRILDWLPERLFTFQEFNKKAGNINVTHGLQHLQTLTVLLGKKVSKFVNTDSRRFVQRIVDLRNNWFKEGKNSRMKQFHNLFSDALIIIEDSIKKMDIFLKENKLISGPSPENNMTFEIPNGPCFSFGGKKGNSVLLPDTFLYFYAAQVKASSGELRNRLIKSFNIDPSKIILEGCIDDNLMEAINKRTKFVCSLFDFFEQNNLKNGLVKYGWFLHE
jgi:hypothetical protein